MLAGSTIETSIPTARARREHVRERLERVLRRGVGAEERERAPPADRAHEDDAPARPAERRQERLQHGDLPDDVHLELAPELVERDELERRRDRDPALSTSPWSSGPTAPRRPRSARASVTSSSSGSTPCSRSASASGSVAHAAEDAPARPRARRYGRRQSPIPDDAPVTTTDRATGAHAPV